MGCVKARDEVEGGCRSNEKPAHQVRLKAFEVSKTETTVGQFRVFIERTGYKTSAEKGDGCTVYDDKGSWKRKKDHFWDKTGFKQTDQHPVVCVSWDDTQAYLEWLNRQVNIKSLGAYRLLTEAEWEGVARGGETKQAYPWGNTVSHEHANYGKEVCCEPFKSGKDQWDYTAPVASFSANGFGLYDLHGNVWEWVQDKYHNNYKKAPKDGSAWEAGEGAYRVFRGGSWDDTSRNLRSADRSRSTPVNRLNDLGFRLARSPVK